MRRLLIFALLVPLATAGVVQRSVVDVEAANSVGPAILAAGDIGSANLGASATSATVTLGSLPLLTANDILKLPSTDDSWNVHAELVSQSGWGALESITISFADGAVVEPQIAISLGGVTRVVGAAVDLPEVGSGTEIRVLGSGKGSVTFDVVLEPDGGGAELRYRIVLQVT